jgi:hypothetical protein
MVSATDPHGRILGFCERIYVLVRANRYSSEWLASIFKGPIRVGLFSFHLRMEIALVSETSSFLVFRIPDDGQSPENL